MKVFKVELMVVDTDGIGSKGIREVLENTHYPNRCIAPTVVSTEQRDIEWSDDHPLNRSDTCCDEFERLFAETGPASAARNSSEGTAA